MFGLHSKKKRREGLFAEGLTDEQRAVVLRDVPYAARLSDADRRELEGHTRVFLDEKRFEGAGGLTLTEEMKLTIAAQACVLLVHRETDYYPNLESIVVYPRAYKTTTRRRMGGVVVESEEARAGESWGQGTVVLAWDHVEGGARHPETGHNVVLHEFAHQLDSEDGSVDGAPQLGTRARYSAWAHVLGEQYAELVLRVAAHKPDVLDSYGATSPPEFFAVATETFFEKPLALRRRHPALYAELAGFYQQDPAALPGSRELPG